MADQHFRAVLDLLGSDGLLGALVWPRPGENLFGRREQLFRLNSRSPLPARSVLVFYPSHTAARTRIAAGKCKLIATADPQRFSVVLDDGKRLDFDLEALNVESP